MPRRDVPREFRALTRMLRSSRQPNWQLRCVEISREDRLRTGLLRGTLRTHAILRPSRGFINISIPDLPTDAVARFRRIMRQLGYRRHHYPPYAEGYTRPSEATVKEAESERRLVLEACHSGSVAMERRRGLLPKRITTPAKEFLHQGAGWTLLRLAETKGPSTWKPVAIFVHRVRTVRAEGHPWRVYYQGYWEPSDKERPGFEIGVYLVSRDEVTRSALARLWKSGFIQRMAGDFVSMGFEEFAPDPAKQLQKLPHWYTFHFKGVLDPGRFEAESRKLLAWKPR